MTTISVAMATYRGERWIEAQLRSIIAQSVPVGEIVITDDSPDQATADIARKTLRVSGIEHRIERNANRLGPARNFEKAATLCEGELIFLADQDDLWKPNKVSRLASELVRKPSLAAVFSNGDLYSADTRHGHRSLWDAVGFTGLRQTYDLDALGVHLKRNVVTGATMAIRSSALGMLLPVSPHGLHDEWFGLLLAATEAMAPVDDRLIVYRIHDANVAGVLPASLRGQLRMRRALICNEDRLVNLYQEAMHRLTDSAPGSVLDRFAGKIEFLTRRGRLPSSGARRTAAVLQDVRSGNYRRYAETWKGPLFDVVFGGPRSY